VGLGKVLALGSAGAAQKLGRGFEYLTTVRGVEVAMHDPRNARYWARVYQYDPTPGRHTKGGLGLFEMLSPPADINNYEGTGPLDVAGASHTEMVNSVGLCMFSAFVSPPDSLNTLLEASTGWSFKQEDSHRAGVRILTMRHVFNLREGLKPADFVIPPRVVGKPPQKEGPNAGRTIDHRALGNNFFDALGWDKETGKPGRGVLEMLGGMENMIQDLL
jgi:aldehyde:ferredoxin oxidoreductase